MFRYMSRFLSLNKRPVSPRWVSFRPQLEILEGRAVPSGLVPVSQDLAPQAIVQSPAQIQVKEVFIESAHQFDHVSLKGTTVPHTTNNADNLKTTPPPSTDPHAAVFNAAAAAGLNALNAGDAIVIGPGFVPRPGGF